MSRFHVRWHLQSKFIKGKIIGFSKFSTIYLEFFTTDCKKKLLVSNYISKSFAWVSECRAKIVSVFAAPPDGMVLLYSFDDDTWLITCIVPNGYYGNEINFALIKERK